MNRKELALLAVSTLLTLLLALGAIRWLAPQLLGGPADLQLVRTGAEVPPFFEGVFRPEHFSTVDFLLRDPRTLNRARPFHGEIPAIALGPHDVLGFRNRAVPAVADVVTIGDSQTYGVNVLLEDNWPSQMGRALRGASVYNMAVGSWGAVQYADMFTNAAAFRPRVVVVAFYTGNDPLESFALAYGSETWRALRPDEGVRADEAPAIAFPPPESERWTSTLASGPVAFAPRLRLLNNNDHRAVDAGYGVIRNAAERMAAMARRDDIRAVFTIIPTKELVYAPRIAAERIEPSADYAELVRLEQERISGLARYIAALPNATYVDTVGPLQQAARTQDGLYPRTFNGHPAASGYGVIADAVAKAVAPLLPPVPAGWVALATDTDGEPLPLLVRDGTGWVFRDRTLIGANGWTRVELTYVEVRDLAGIPKVEVTTVDPARYGPRR